MTTKLPQTHDISLRLSPEHARVIALAAAAERHSISEFVLEGALDRAGEVLSNRRQFTLDAAQWAAFQAALDAAPRDMPRMKRLLDEPSVFSSDWPPRVR